MYRVRRGFTLIEILVVTAIATAAMGFGLLVSMETYRSTGFRTERNTVLALLHRARSQAIANYCAGDCVDGSPHGVAIRPIDNPSAYVLFQGLSYASRDIAADAVFQANTSMKIVGFSEVVFTQLSATASTTYGSDLALSDASGHVSTTTVTAEGRIFWTD